jgi:hypothetical protein
MPGFYSACFGDLKAFSRLLDIITFRKVVNVLAAVGLWAKSLFLRFTVAFGLNGSLFQFKRLAKLTWSCWVVGLTFDVRCVSAVWARTCSLNFVGYTVGLIIGMSALLRVLDGMDLQVWLVQVKRRHEWDALYSDSRVRNFLLFCKVGKQLAWLNPLCWFFLYLRHQFFALVLDQHFGAAIREPLQHCTKLYRLTKEGCWITIRV